MTHLLIVDDHPIVRHGMVQMLSGRHGFGPFDEAGNAAEAIAAFRKQRPDAVLLDLSLGDVSGLEALKQMREIDDSVPILILSMFDEVLHAEPALRAGARGYVMKQEATEVLVDAIQQIIRGDIYLSTTMQQRMLQTFANGNDQTKKTSGLKSLTAREIEILRLIGEGCTSAEIAARLHRSIKTIEAHRASLREKLGVRGTTELLRIAMKYAETGSHSDR